MTEYSLGSAERPLKAAIIGSGPSGFYAAEGLLQTPGVNAEVDMFEYLPTPYGLVRAGVAPDHQSIKSIAKIFDQIAHLPNYRFWGNVEFGRDITIEELNERFDLVIFALGAQSDRALCIKGEELQGSHSATAFVSWYNGHPDYRNYEINLNCKRVIIIGMGNVATDIARILALSPAEMGETDLADYAAEALRNSSIEEIEIVARRGPLQAAFTPVGVRKFSKLEEAVAYVDPAELKLEAVSQKVLEETRGKRILRNLEFLNSIANNSPGSKKKTIRFLFRQTPVEITGENNVVTGVNLVKNELFENESGDISLSLTDSCKLHEAGLVFHSVGYQVAPVAGIQVDEKRGVIANQDGRLIDLATNQVIPGQYVVGWAKRGANGVIGANKFDSQETIKLILDDIALLKAASVDESQAEKITQWLTDKGIHYVRFQEWERINNEELSRGQSKGKPREKITTVQQMLEIADGK